MLGGNEPTAHLGANTRQRPPPSPLAHLVSTASSTLRPSSPPPALAHHSLPTSTPPPQSPPGLLQASALLAPKVPIIKPQNAPLPAAMWRQMPPSNLPLLPEARGSQPSLYTHEFTRGRLLKMQVLGAQAPKVLISQDWRARVCESLVPREHVEKSSFNILSKGRARSVLCPDQGTRCTPPSTC